MQAYDIYIACTHPFFAKVGPLMYVTNVLPCECLSANSAQKGLFRRVSVPLKKRMQHGISQMR